MGENQNTTPAKTNPDHIKPVRDLIDFHVRWREFRPLAASAANAETLSANEASTVNWLIELADRIGENDIRD